MHSFVRRLQKKYFKKISELKLKKLAENLRLSWCHNRRKQ